MFWWVGISRDLNRMVLFVGSVLILGDVFSYLDFLNVRRLFEVVDFGYNFLLLQLSHFASGSLASLYLATSTAIIGHASSYSHRVLLLHLSCVHWHTHSIWVHSTFWNSCWVNTRSLLWIVLTESLFTSARRFSWPPLWAIIQTGPLARHFPWLSKVILYSFIDNIFLRLLYLILGFVTSQFRLKCVTVRHHFLFWISFGFWLDFGWIWRHGVVLRWWEGRSPRVGTARHQI